MTAAGEEDFDYIIVGAGSAGCVLARKLGEDGRASVLVLEAGGSDRHWSVRVPIGYGKTFYDTRVNWRFETEAEAGLQGRRIYVPRGKVVGGSSSINAMVYSRGLPRDFEDWVRLGARGWGWDAVRPVYESFEHPVDAQGVAATDRDGALFVSDVRHALHPIERHFFAAAREIDLPFSDDFNGDAPEGVGRYRINTRRGRRWSAADAFLRPALARGNVQLRTGALVQRVRFEGNTARGVDYVQAGHVHGARARRAVVLAAGAIQSPQLLQVSGVGPGALLQASGVPVLLSQDNVGARLQDHLAMSYHYEAAEPTLNNVLGTAWGRVGVGLRYLATRGGPLSISVNQCGGFVRSHPGAACADMQLYCNPVTYTLTGAGTSSRIVPDTFAGFILCFQPCRPESRGNVRITSPRMEDAPRIELNYLSHPEDTAQAVRA